MTYVKCPQCSKDLGIENFPYDKYTRKFNEVCRRCFMANTKKDRIDLLKKEFEKKNKKEEEYPYYII